MTQTQTATRTLATARYVALRVLIVAAVIGAAAAWQLSQGKAFPHYHVTGLHLHAPRFDLLAQAPAILRLHIAAAVTAFGVGSALLLGVKGNAVHRVLGYTWITAMMTTAISSIFIRVINPGHWSFIHFLSGWVIIAVPIGLVAIKRRNVRLHRRTMTGLFVGGLVIAGAFTFVPGRLMYAVFFG